MFTYLRAKIWASVVIKRFVCCILRNLKMFQIGWLNGLLLKFCLIGWFFIRGGGGENWIVKIIIVKLLLDLLFGLHVQLTTNIQPVIPNQMLRDIFFW